MSKRLGTYLLPAVLLLAALLPGRVCAQLDARSLMRAQQRGENTNLYGVPNPAPEDEAVSYTHLTLPTSCKV